MNKKLCKAVTIFLTAIMVFSMIAGIVIYFI